MRTVLSLLYWLYAGTTLPILYAIAAVIFVVAYPFDRRRIAVHMFTCVWGYMYVAFNPLWRTRLEGGEKLPWKGPAVIVANHLSLLDILVVHGYFRPFKWVAKGELFRVPFIGWNMILNDYVRVWRGERDSVKRMLAHCRRHLERGSAVIIFPEGTRSRDGNMQPFKDGAFKLAAEVGCPLIPVAIQGSYEALPKNGLIFRQRATIRVRVLDPLDPKGFESTEALKVAAQAAIAANVAQLSTLSG